MHTANVSLISNLPVFQTICLLRNGLDFQIYNKRVHVLRNLIVGTRGMKGSGLESGWDTPDSRLPSQRSVKLGPQRQS